jgi:hypothetical protein
MHKNIKLLFILAVIAVAIVIIITNILLNKYEKESLSIKAGAPTPKRLISQPEEEKNILQQEEKESVEEEEGPPVSKGSRLAY